MKKRRMDIRKQIQEILESKPGETFSINALARQLDTTSKSITASLGRMLESGTVERPQKGQYMIKKKGRTAPAPTAEKAQPVKKQEKAETESSSDVASVTLSVINLELLVEGDPSTIDTRELLSKLQEQSSILDVRVKNVSKAQHQKLRITFAFAE